MAIFFPFLKPTIAVNKSPWVKSDSKDGLWVKQKRYYEKVSWYRVIVVEAIAFTEGEKNKPKTPESLINFHPLLVKPGINTEHSVYLLRHKH